MTDDGRCATCTHYQPPDGIWDRHREHWMKLYGLCRLADSISGEPVSESLAVAVDAEQYNAWLFVHPNFGCVQWAEGGPR